MAAKEEDAVLRVILENMKSAVNKASDGVSMGQMQRLLARLPARVLGPYQPSVDTIRLAIERFPSTLYVHADGTIRNTKPSSGPQVGQWAKVSARKTEEPVPVLAEGRIDVIKEKNYGFITTHYPVKRNVFYHKSAAIGWPPGLGGPKVGDVVEVEITKSEPGYICDFMTSVVRYVARPEAVAETPPAPEVKRTTIDEEGVITFVRPDLGILQFGDEEHEKAFFDKRSVPKTLLRSGEKLTDVFSAKQRVYFEALPCLKADAPCKWYCTLVSTVRGASKSSVFTDGDFMVNPPPAATSTVMGVPPTGDKHRQVPAAPKPLNCNVQPARKPGSAAREGPIEPTVQRESSGTQNRCSSEAGSDQWKHVERYTSESQDSSRLSQCRSEASRVCKPGSIASEGPMNPAVQHQRGCPSESSSGQWKNVERYTSEAQDSTMLSHCRSEASRLCKPGSVARESPVDSAVQRQSRCPLESSSGEWSKAQVSNWLSQCRSEASSSAQKQHEGTAQAEGASGFQSRGHGFSAETSHRLLRIIEEELKKAFEEQLSEVIREMQVRTAKRFVPAKRPR